jgi:hypothetical protein
MKDPFTQALDHGSDLQRKIDAVPRRSSMPATTSSETWPVTMPVGSATEPGEVRAGSSLTQLAVADQENVVDVVAFVKVADTAHVALI